MPVRTLEIAEPFFTIRLVTDETRYSVGGKVILLNLSPAPIRIREQSLAGLESAIVANVDLRHLDHAVVVERFSDHDDEAALFSEVARAWPTAFDMRKEDRLRGISHHMSPKIWVEQCGFTLYYSGSVPLKVGLHRDHPFCPVPGFREIHTQIVGFGKMQQCREQDISTLYLEEQMAPGATHRPMYDSEGNYPWHQYETITPSIFMAVEMLPENVHPQSEAQS
ncbi:MAG: hypothetical protein NXI27_07630 [Alphaproteobacteria bacterium]|nr:hypothetical protein [Alphaproteobacteria bacterium]